MKYSPQFIVHTPRPAAAWRLFCFPHAGGGPVVFHDWPERLGAQIECVCLQYPGRAHRLREKPHARVADLVGEITDGMGGFDDKPFAFFGHSFGGILAFELARNMQSFALSGLQHLFVAATRPPHLESPFPPIHQLADADFVASVQSRYGGIPSAILRDPEVLEMFLPAMRADFAAYETYRMEQRPPLDIPITAFGGAEDMAVPPESLREWALHTASGFGFKVLPGGHFFPATSRNELVSELQLHLAAHSTLAG